MNIYPIVSYKIQAKTPCRKFEEAFFDSHLKHSFKNLTFVGDISKESILEALGKSMKICDCAGENSKHHFKQIYIFDKDSNSLHIDWLMSKTGFRILILQIPALNKKMSEWIWKLVDEKN